MAISSDTLFHFTNSLEVLYKILEEGFWPRYCKETGWKGEGDPLFATSMVSFCNIPLSQIHQHINYYGHYGIGVSKEWALDSHIRPIYYITREMIPFIQKIIGKVFYKNETDEKSKAEMGKKYFVNYKQILSLMKIWKGWNWAAKGESNDRKIIRNYVYYNEREWRYVPPIPNSGFIVKVRNANVDLEEWNQKSKTYCMKIKPKDIKYIIIKSEDERIDVLKNIDNILGKNISAKEISLLKSKILTCDQIEKDF